MKRTAAHSLPRTVRATRPALAAPAALALALACAPRPTEAPATDVVAPAPAPAPAPACRPLFPTLDPGAPRRSIELRLEVTSAAFEAQVVHGLTGPQLLVLSWVDGATADVFRERGFLPIAGLLGFVARSEAFTIDAEVLRGARPIVCELSHGELPGDAVAAAPVPFAVLDHHHSFWSTILGDRGTNLVGIGEASEDAEAPAVVVLRGREAKASAPASDTTKSPAGDAAKRPASDSAKRPASDSAKQPASDSNRSPASDSTKQPASDSNKSSASDSNKSPASDSAKRPADKLTATPAPRRAHCEGPRMRHLLVPHDGADPLHLCVRLPSSYDRAAARRYPVVYLLPGLLGDDMTRLGDDRFLAILDEFDRAGREAIFVGVDTRSPHGSLYVRAGGPDELGEFLLETFARIDGELRSDARPEGRILLGQSTGGFNVVAFALAHPGVVGGIGASAPDGLDLEAWLLESPTALRPEWFSWMRLEDAVGGVGQMVSYARAWSPGDGRGWPVSLTTGAPNPPVLDAWLAQSPARRAATPEGTAALRALGGRLLVAVADNDEFELYEPARRFCALLEAQGVAHTLKVDHAGHVGVDPRFTDFLDRLLPPAAPSKTRPARKSK